MFRLDKLPPIFGAFAFVTILVMIPFIGLLLWIAFASVFRIMWEDGPLERRLEEAGPLWERGPIGYDRSSPSHLGRLVALDRGSVWIKRQSPRS